MTNKIIQLLVKDVITRDTAVSSDDGDILFGEIEKHFQAGEVVELDFTDITLITTAFLNTAIGQLYNEHTGDQLNTLLKLTNVAEEDKILFKKVIDRAKEYFANKKGFEDSADTAIYGN